MDVSMRMMKELRHLFDEERLKCLVLFSLEKTRQRGDLINIVNGCQEEGGILFLVPLCDRTKVKGHKLEHRKSHLNRRKNLFTSLL